MSKLAIICINFVDIRDVDKWSPRMRAPMEDVYGKEHFKELWNGWIDAYSSYLTNHDGDIVKERVKEIQHRQVGRHSPFIGQVFYIQ